MAFEELVQRVSKEWKGASPERKAECEAEAKRDYERYANEMEVYKQRPEVFFSFFQLPCDNSCSLLLHCNLN